MVKDVNANLQCAATTHSSLGRRTPKLDKYHLKTSMMAQHVKAPSKGSCTKSLKGSRPRPACKARSTGGHDSRTRGHFGHFELNVLYEEEGTLRSNFRTLRDTREVTQKWPLSEKLMQSATIAHAYLRTEPQPRPIADRAAKLSPWVVIGRSRPRDEARKSARPTAKTARTVGLQAQ